MKTILPATNDLRLRIGIVQARFSNEIGSAMLKVAHQKLIELGVADDDIVVATVPGALEIPLALQQMARARETYHFELVSNESGAGITRVGLDHDIPIANAVLTTENDEQAHARIEEKARDAALVAVEGARLKAALHYHL